MALIVPKEGELEFLKRIFSTTTLVEVKVGLFKDVMTLSETTIIEDFDTTEIDDDTSYEQISVENSAWSYPAIEGGDNAVVTTDSIEFVLNPDIAGYDVYGYFVTQTIEGETKLLWAEEFPSAFKIDGTSGGSINLNLKLELE